MAVTLLAILHVIADSDNPQATVAQVMEALPSASYLAVSHAGSDLLDKRTLDSLKHIVTNMVHLAPGFRTREQVGRFFAGMGLVEPGLVRVGEWQRGPVAEGADETMLRCGVGRKR